MKPWGFEETQQQRHKQTESYTKIKKNWIKNLMTGILNNTENNNEMNTIPQDDNPNKIGK